MFGLPFELITMACSFLGGLWSKKMDNDHDFKIAALGAQREAYDEARKDQHPSTTKTRQFITISAVFAIIVWPKLVAVFWPEIPIMAAYTEMVQGFLFFTDDQEVIKWQEFTGLVITPIDTHTIAAILGFYLGQIKGTR